MGQVKRDVRDRRDAGVSDKRDMRDERVMSGEGQRETIRGQEVSCLSSPSCLSRPTYPSRPSGPSCPSCQSTPCQGSKPKIARPVCHVVAGPNGAGKSTFALDYLPEFAGSIEYVNPDLMAQGLSPTDITLSALKAGKLTLRRIAELIGRRVSFGFESTLAGRGHLKLLADAKAAGYAIHLYYLWMPSAVMLPLRIRHRVLAGGHDVPPTDVSRRYARSVANLRDYAALVDVLRVFDATGLRQTLLYTRNGKATAYGGAVVAAMRKDLGL